MVHHLGGTSLLVEGASLEASQVTAAWLLETVGELRTVLVASGPAVVAESVLEELHGDLQG